MSDESGQVINSAEPVSVGGQRSPLPAGIRLGRHAVGWAAGSAVVAFWFFGFRSMQDWLVLLFALVTAAAAVTGLAALFFTRSQAGKATSNFILTTWVLLGLVALGAAPSVKSLFLTQSAPTTAEQRGSFSPFDQLRREQPELAGASDDVIFRVLQMENPGVAPEKIAAQFGYKPTGTPAR